MGKPITIEDVKDVAEHGKGESDGAAKTGPNELIRYLKTPGNSGYGVCWKLIEVLSSFNGWVKYGRVRPTTASSDGARTSMWVLGVCGGQVTAKTLAGYDKCKMRPEFSPPTIVHIESAKPDAAKVALSRKKLGEYAQSLKVGDVVVVRSTPDDDGNTYDEAVYVAKLTKKAEKLTKTTRIAGETFSKGWWMCRIKWLWFVREDEEGSFFYRLKSRD